jgi:hypothetical protein
VALDFGEQLKQPDYLQPVDLEPFSTEFSQVEPAKQVFSQSAHNDQPQRGAGA